MTRQNIIDQLHEILGDIPIHEEPPEKSMFPFDENPPIDFKKIDLQARFYALNKSLFGGELPQIPLSFVKSKTASGMTDIRIVSKGSSISLLRMMNKVTPDLATITVTGIKINTVRTYDDVEFDGILAHEMIHALVALRGNPFCQHGLQFLTMRREIQERTGLNIPLSHNLSEAGIDAKEREVGIMVLGKREGEAHEAFLMFQPKALDVFVERYSSYARTWHTSIKFYLLHTKAWAATTVKTKPDRYGVKLQWLKPALGIDLSDAWLAREIQNPDQTKRDIFAKMEEVATEVARETSRNPISNNLALCVVNEEGIEFRTGQQVLFRYIRNTERCGRYGKTFAQDIEPHGRFMLHREEMYELPKSWERGEITFGSPLVLKLTTGEDIYGPDGWKARLSRAFGGKKGKSLSKAILKAGYDGIVTCGANDTREIVDLTVIK